MEYHSVTYAVIWILMTIPCMVFISGDCAGQQVWESLIILVALRAWKDVWQTGRFSIIIRSDNITALVMALRLKSPPGGAKRIAKELALDLTFATWIPLIVEHIPGISNALADILSRRRDPAHEETWRLPRVLERVPETRVPVRDATYYYL